MKCIAHKQRVVSKLLHAILQTLVTHICDSKLLFLVGYIQYFMNYSKAHLASRLKIPESENNDLHIHINIIIDIIKTAHTIDVMLTRCPNTKSLLSSMC